MTRDRWSEGAEGLISESMKGFQTEYRREQKEQYSLFDKLKDTVKYCQKGGYQLAHIEVTTKDTLSTMRC